VSGSPEPYPDNNAVGIEYISDILQTKRAALPLRITDALDTLEQSGAIASRDTVLRAQMDKKAKMSLEMDAEERATLCCSKLVVSTGRTRII
jgi:hypothetical protein